MRFQVFVEYLNNIRIALCDYNFIYYIMVYRLELFLFFFLVLVN